MLLSLLLLLPGEVHVFHQSQRLHHDRHLRQELLLVRQRIILAAHAKHCQVGPKVRYAYPNTKNNVGSHVHAFRVTVLDKVTDFLLLLGKLVIVGAMGVSSFYIFSGE